MKPLKRIQINPEKVMNNTEMKNIRGGYDQLCCRCILEDPPYTIVGSIVADGPWQCSYWCGQVNNDWTGAWQC